MDPRRADTQQTVCLVESVKNAKNILFWHKIVFLIQHADSQRADNVAYLSVVWSVYLEV